MANKEVCGTHCEFCRGEPTEYKACVYACCTYPSGSIGECFNKAIGLADFPYGDCMKTCAEHAQGADEFRCFAGDHDEVDCPLKDWSPQLSGQADVAGTPPIDGVAYGLFGPATNEELQR